MRTRIFLTILASALTIVTASSQKPWGNWLQWGEQTDGTFQNPVIPADYSDLDCIRVGDDFYAISSTMQYSPGMTILHSTDLVNWEIAGNAVADLSQISSGMTYREMDRYGRGIWAGTLRHHKGRFYLFFGTPDEGFFMTTASKAEGPWEPLVPLLQEKGWDDCSAIWDEKGRAWFIGTCFSDGYKTYIFPMKKNGKGIERDKGRLVNSGWGREASKLIYHDGYYYIVFSEHRDGIGRYVMAKRDRDMTGTFEEEKQLLLPCRESNEPNQGGIIQGPDGKWYFLTHHGSGDWSGRIVSLLPVGWRDGWPMMGDISEKTPGSMVWEAKMPAVKTEKLTMARSDEFEASVLGPQWQWNYQPRDDMWSLTERPGWVRLKAYRPLENDKLLKAGNTLTQRSFRSTHNEVTIKMDISHMADGQHAGLAHFASRSGCLGVMNVGGTLYLETREDDRSQRMDIVTNGEIWLRSVWGLDGVARFSYSLDGREFTTVNAYPLSWGFYRGDRIGIYCYNNLSDNGQVDIDFLHYELSKEEKPKNHYGKALVPDMIADASIELIGDTFYCYATTDGYGRGLETSGPPVVWKSKDFVNWSFDGTYFPSAFKEKYWAPSKAVAANGKWYIYPTVNHFMHVAVADSPDGPFRLVAGPDAFDKPYSKDATLLKEGDREGIDAEIFIDDDGQAYAFWGRRRVARLHPDMMTIDSVYTLETRRKEYSEGPIFFKRKGIYYYLYTIGGDENYEYYYMMSRTSPLGPYITPAEDRVSTTSYMEDVYGPGHGCVFNVGDDYYFAFLEFGRNSTNRQTYVNRIEFNDDGTIRPVKVDLKGVGALLNVPQEKALSIRQATASSVKKPQYHRFFNNSHCLRNEYYLPEYAFDEANGSRWMAADDDKTPYLIVDLGEAKHIRRSEIAFVRPTQGHSYRLEGSLNGFDWERCGGNDDNLCKSPNTDAVERTYRYLKVTITNGVTGIWEWKVY